MSRLIIFSCFLVFGSAAFSQSVTVNVHFVNKANRADGDTIYYAANRPLVWSDFKGRPDPNHFGGAVTASGFAYSADMEYDSRNVNMDIYVYTFFTKHDSWKKPNINSDYHLEHEQKHFDITYLGAMKFVQDLQQAKFTAGNFKKLPAQIFDKAYAENTALQQQYDRETKHSINKDVQQIWNRRIEEMLAAAEQ